MSNIPDDVFTNYILKNENLVLVQDPKNTDLFYHFTIWFLNDIDTIYNINKKDVSNLLSFLDEVKKMNIFENEEIYFTYPPTHKRLHCHIVSKTYISYRPLNEIYYLSDIENILKNICIINKINQDKRKSNKLQLNFTIGIAFLKDFKKINLIENFKSTNKINYIVVVRQTHSDKYIEYLISTNKFINCHFISFFFNNYEKMLDYDNIIYL